MKKRNMSPKVGGMHRRVPFRAVYWRFLRDQAEEIPSPLRISSQRKRRSLHGSVINPKVEISKRSPKKDISLEEIDLGRLVNLPSEQNVYFTPSEDGSKASTPKHGVHFPKLKGIGGHGHGHVYGYPQQASHKLYGGERLYRNTGISPESSILKFEEKNTHMTTKRLCVNPPLNFGLDESQICKVQKLVKKRIARAFPEGEIPQIEIVPERKIIQKPRVSGKDAKGKDELVKGKDEPVKVKDESVEVKDESVKVKVDRKPWEGVTKNDGNEGNDQFENFEDSIFDKKVIKTSDIPVKVLFHPEINEAKRDEEYRKINQSFVLQLNEQGGAKARYSNQVMRLDVAKDTSNLGGSFGSNYSSESSHRGRPTRGNLDVIGNINLNKEMGIYGTDRKLGRESNRLIDLLRTSSVKVSGNSKRGGGGGGVGVGGRGEHMNMNMNSRDNKSSNNNKSPNKSPSVPSNTQNPQPPVPDREGLPILCPNLQSFEVENDSQFNFNRNSAANGRQSNSSGGYGKWYMRTDEWERVKKDRSPMQNTLIYKLSKGTTPGDDDANIYMANCELLDKSIEHVDKQIRDIIRTQYVEGGK